MRADLDTSICIQGAPGTGKTAGRPAPRGLPALHLSRAAAPLRRARRRPNRAFLHYIAQVLPALGEGGIEQATVGDLMPWPVRADESADLATLKGDARMADVLRRAVLSHVAKPTEDVVAIVEALPHRRTPSAPLRRRRPARRHPLVDRARAAEDAGGRGRPAPARGRRWCAERRRHRQGRAVAGGARVHRPGLAGARPGEAARPAVQRRRLPAPLLGHDVDRRRARAARRADRARSRARPAGRPRTPCCSTNSRA